MMNHKLAQILSLLLLLSACGKEAEKPLPPPAEAKPAVASKLELHKKNFADLPGWALDNQGEAMEAFLRSCKKIATTKSEFIGNAEVKIPAAPMKRLCREAAQITPEAFRKFLEVNFTPYLVTFGGSPIGKFTSYYEPLIHVSHEKSDKYKYPIHAKPLDLIEFNPRDFDASMPSKRLIGRVDKQKLVPYYSRTEILQNKGDVPVLLWSDSFVDVYVMHIQGPAVAVLPDGSQIRISYADNNGHEFKGIGSILLKHGVVPPGGASMDKIKKWLVENPEQALPYMNENPRYIFHRLIGAPGPIGALGVPLMDGRSLAVDRSFIPLGALLWLDTTTPDKHPLRRLVNAQDIGGAIKGAVRGDYFWGSGGDEVLVHAGKMNAEGSYFILLPKPEKD